MQRAAAVATRLLAGSRTRSQGKPASLHLAAASASLAAQWVEFLCFDINVHVPHHVMSKIPWYNLRAATDSLRKVSSRAGTPMVMLALVGASRVPAAYRPLVQAGCRPLAGR